MTEDQIQDAGMEYAQVPTGANGQFELDSQRVDGIIESHNQEVAESIKKINLEMEDGSQEFNKREINRATKKSEKMKEMQKKVDDTNELEAKAQKEIQNYRNETLEFFIKSDRASIALAFDDKYVNKFITDGEYEKVDDIDQGIINIFTGVVPTTYQRLFFRNNYYYKPRVQWQGKNYLYDITAKEYKLIGDADVNQIKDKSKTTVSGVQSMNGLGMDQRVAVGTSGMTQSMAIRAVANEDREQRQDTESRDGDDGNR